MYIYIYIKSKIFAANRNAFLTKQSRRIRNESREHVIVRIYTAFFNDQRVANNKRLVKAIRALFRFRHQKTMPMFVPWKKETLTNERAR